MKLLLIEDSKRLRRSIQLGLKREGYQVDVSGDGNDGLWKAESNEYDAIILDLMLPGMDGLTILQRLRSEGNRVPILILSAKDTIDDRVKGLKAGSDDYLVKPFSFEEFLARIEALIRRHYKIASTEIKIGDIVIDLAKKSVLQNAVPIDLTPREFKTLEFLAYKAGCVVTRAEIETRIYDEMVEPMSNVVDSTICNLRSKLDKKGKKSLIQTKRGMGYQLNIDAK